MQHSEPALLVGDTGTGKTTVCQMLTLMRGQKLHIINCNQHTETSDFLGGFRPVRSLTVHSSCVAPPCMVASMHAGSVGAFLWTGICNHVSPTAMNVNCDWPVVHVIPQWLPAYITILLRLRPHPTKGGFGSCMSHQMLPANAADAGSLTAGQGIRHRHKHVTTWP